MYPEVNHSPSQERYRLKIFIRLFIMGLEPKVNGSPQGKLRCPTTTQIVCECMAGYFKFVEFVAQESQKVGPASIFPPTS